MKQRIIFSVVFAIAFFITTKCFSDDRLGAHGYSSQKFNDVSFFVGEKTWQSAGEDKWNIAGTQSGGPPTYFLSLSILD